MYGSPRVGENGTPHPCKDGVISQYMFCVVTENEIYSNYFTEKITDCFATKTIPIYYGSPCIAEYFNSDGILFLNPEKDFNFNCLNVNLYLSMKNAIDDNFDRVSNMLMSDDQIFNYIKECE